MTGKAKKPHAPNLKKDDFVNAIDKLSQELKDLLKSCINTTCLNMFKDLLKSRINTTCLKMFKDF